MLFGLGPWELIIMIIAGINCLVPVAILVLTFLIYQKLQQIEQKLDG